MVRDVVSELQEVLQKEKVPAENPTIIPEQVNYVDNAVQSTQPQLTTKLQQMKATMQEIQMQYAAAPQHAHQDAGGRGYHGGKKIIVAKEDAVRNAEENGEVTEVAVTTVI